MRSFFSGLGTLLLVCGGVVAFASLSTWVVASLFFLFVVGWVIHSIVGLAMWVIVGLPIRICGTQYKWFLPVTSNATSKLNNHKQEE